MAKKLITFGIAILLLFSIAGLTACKPEYNDEYRTISTEYFKVALHDKDGYAIVYELTDLGKKQEILSIPSHIEGLPITQIGWQLLWGAIGISSDNLKKIYIPYNVENIINKNAIIANLDEAILVQHDLKYVSAQTIVISQDYYDSLQSTVGVMAEHKPANIVYYFNYESSPNSNIFWIDLITGTNLHLAPQQPMRDGYTFTGWFTDEDATVQWDGTLPSSAYEKIDLFAGWNKN